MFKRQQSNNSFDSGSLRETELSWETSRLDLIQKSERKAWNIAKLLSCVVFFLCITLCLLMPLKSVEPFVIQTYKSTGLSTILHIANTQDIPVNEMTNKYWLSQYVLAREGYDWQTIDQEYFKVRELSLPKVFEPYASQFGASNKNGLDSTLKDNYRIIVRLNSVVINNDYIATVRFAKVTYDKNANVETDSKTWTATIAFEYFPDFDVSEERRLVNPFGFKVTSYRVDEEIH